MVPKGTLSAEEIKNGGRVESLEFGDLLFRGVVENPSFGPDGLIYGYTAPERKLVYTEVSILRSPRQNRP